MKLKSQKTLRKDCLSLWSEIVKERDNFTCIICNRKNIRLNSHHLISKKIIKYKFDINNGITLCANCHVFSPICSPHLAPWKFEEELKYKSPSQYEWWIKNRKNLKYPLGFKIDYVDMIRELTDYKSKIRNF